MNEVINMKTSTALAHYSNSPLLLGSALGISSQAVSQWGEDVPKLRALQLEKMTNGELKADGSSSNDEDIEHIAYQ